MFMSKLEQVVEAVKDILGIEYSVQGIKVSKNNGVKADGILIRDNGQQVGGIVYVSKNHLENATISEIADSVYCEYQDSFFSKTPLDDIENFLDKEFVLSNVVYQLINRQKNIDFLDSAPYKEFLDLALSYRVVLSVDDKSISSYAVSNDFIAEAGISIEELDKAAKENTINRLGMHFSNLEEMFRNHFSHKKAVSQLYVLTSNMKINGAVLITYNDILSELAEKLGSNLFILPSSIHEVLIFAEHEDVKIEHLRDMVQNINAFEVPEQDFLSNSVYRFVKDTGVVELA